MFTAWRPASVHFLILFSATAASATNYTISLSAVQSLNSTLNGRLMSSTPFSLPCFTRFSAANGSTNLVESNSEACSSVITNYFNSDVRTDTFGAFKSTQWETCQSAGQQCLLDDTNPSNPAAFSPPAVCHQGAVPPFHVNATSAQDILAVFDFSRRTKTPLSIKNTGHEFLGRSGGANTLSLWMRGFNGISHNPSFVPRGCRSRKGTSAATIGASVTWDAAYQFAEDNGITIPGGADPSLGAAAGYIMSGGHSILSNAFGLAVDRVLEFEVVTPNGQHLFANECQNTDLFFALRGGGGGTYGVVLQATTAVFPKMSFSTVLVSLPASRQAQAEFLSFMTNHTIEYMEQGWGGYYNPSGSLVFANPLLNASAALASMQELQTFVTTKLESNFTLAVQPSYKAMFENIVRPVDPPIGLPFSPSTRFIPREQFKTAKSRATLISTITPAMNSAPLTIIFFVSPIFFGDKGGTSINPVWRNSPWHFTISNFWNYNTTNTQRRKIYTDLSRALDPIRELTPNSGALSSDADLYEPDWQYSFWGPNYNRLLKIKEKYDPDHLLDCWRCVGWRGERNPRYSCYDQLLDTDTVLLQDAA